MHTVYLCALAAIRVSMPGRDGGCGRVRGRRDEAQRALCERVGADSEGSPDDAQRDERERTESTERERERERVIVVPDLAPQSRRPNERVS